MYRQNIKLLAKQNTDFRHVVFTTPRSQLVLMSLNPQEEIGMEAHQLSDQLFFFIDGRGQAIVDGQTLNVDEHDALVVPAGSLHNIINTNDEDLKFYTIYTPPTHPDGTVYHTKQDAMAAEKIV